MDVVCPIDWRYGSEEMRRIFTREGIIKYRIRVELALLHALKELGYLSEDEYVKVEKASESITPEEVDKLEAKLGHDVMALVVSMAERAGDAGRFVHFGATSYDIVDTAYALMFRDALSILKDKMIKSLEKLKDLTLRYQDQVMVGRTHAQHAVPITLGFKFANYLYEMTRSLERLVEVEKRVVLGKMSGAVGTMASWGKDGLRIEQLVMEKLNLSPHSISTQVAPRDGFAELISDLAIAGSVMDRFAIEVRELMRPEIGEIAEGVGERVGSSTMPHKENPVTAEKISGLSKLLRGMVISELENIPLWHERDLTNSSSERFIISHAFLIMDEMMDSFYELLSNLRVNLEAMERNLELSKGLNMAESLMINLTLKGIPRHKAHEMVSRISREARKKNTSLLEEAMKDKIISSTFSREELERILNPKAYLGQYKAIIGRAIDSYERLLNRLNEARGVIH
ncbi:adenylosuccinate lyase [Metallosphaera javensis (ex Sakai et al. 2022)]|uniref:adenylosuccinate lyase n=1 Tax=Metallosphaera javensis (ex Sakai et al. 2022) TaxID=2775498 RepID=UPI00258EE4B4|nr:MAG: argininosuccinate lyase [Metallosphaera javensis (ex Sakai et al. 2022)]